VKELLSDETLKVEWTNQENNNCLRKYRNNQDMAAANGHLEILRRVLQFVASNPTVKNGLLKGKNCDGNTPLRIA